MNSLSKLSARTAAVVLSVLALTSAPAARTPDEVRAICRAEGRPCVGLVLSGGGARGFAHVGVLEELERLGVKIDVVTGTSMGSMIGGAYAAGYAPKEVEGIVLGVDWDRMLAPRVTRSELPRRLKEDDYRGLSSGGITLDGKGRARLPEGIVPSQELSIFLQSNTDRVSMVRELSRLPVPFAAPATDLVTGERVVMSEDCNLGEAMRASMSVPGAFEPFAHKGRLLVDGGLVDNLPVELAREMGADVIIAVNVGTPLYKRDELKSVVGVMAQMVNLLTEQNVRTSLASLGERDILITPDLEGFSSADLKKSAEIIQRGREAAKRHENALAQLASDKKDYAAWDLARREIILDAVEHPTHTLTAVRVEGGTRLAHERIIASADIPVGEPVSTAEIEEGTRRVWSQGYFERVAYRFEPGPNGTEVLVLEPRERRENYATIRLGGSIETDFRGGSTFDVIGSYTWHLANAWGAEWKTEVQVGEEQRVATEFYQPLGTSSSLFVTPSIELYRSPYDVWENGSAVASAHDTVLDVRLELGSEFGRLGAVSGFAGWLEQQSSSDVGRRPGGEETYRSPYVGAALNLDTLDSINFPTSGMRLSLQGYVTEGNAGDSGKGHHYLGSLTLPYAWGPWAVATTLEAGESTRRSTFRLGGARQMIGSDYGRWVGSRMQYGRIGLARNMSGELDWSAFPIWFGATVEAGRAWDPSSPEGTGSSNDAWHKAASVYAGVDSPFGPIFITFGRTFGEGTAVYFSWGHRQ